MRTRRQIPAACRSLRRDGLLRRTLPAFLALLTLLAFLAFPIACNHRGSSGPTGSATAPGSLFPLVPASQAFWGAWGDGKAEIATYRLTTPRYGELRDGVAVLIYVLEEHDRRTWIKNDRGDVPESERAVVMKLNHTTSFQTGIYPYSVMTSVFSPVGGVGRERFAPTRVVLTSQEWCGLVYERVMPKVAGFDSEIRSYFSAEGDAETFVATPPYALYEDALLVQLRELDGPFMDGGDWAGAVVPTLWARRKDHDALSARSATISRTDAVRVDGSAVTRFVLRYEGSVGAGTHPGPYERTFDVEKAAPHRVLAWTTSEGEQAELVTSDRLEYWRLNAEGDERFRDRLGLDRDGPHTVAPSR